MIEAIEQGVCTECNERDDNYSQLQREYDSGFRDDEDEEDVPATIERQIGCSCGARATVTITENGIETDGPISHEDASWNQEDENEETSDA